jgi:hypothetical protein
MSASPHKRDYDRSWRKRNIEHVRAYERRRYHLVKKYKLKARYDERTGKTARLAQGIFDVCRGAGKHINPVRDSTGRCLSCRQTKVKGMQELWQNRKQLKAVRKVLLARSNPALFQSHLKELRTAGILPS